MTAFITEQIFTEDDCERFLAWLTARTPAAAPEPPVVEPFCLTRDYMQDDPALLALLDKFQEWLVHLCADDGFTWVALTLAALRYQPGAGMDRHAHGNREEGAPNNGFAATVQLTAPDQYGGGDFVLDDSTVAPRVRGLAVATEDGVGHRVTEVTHGTRWMLTAWIGGVGSDSAFPGPPSRVIEPLQPGGLEPGP